MIRSDPARQDKKRRATEAREAAQPPVAQAAIGLEAEFTVHVDGEQVRPEDVFRSPTTIVRGPMMHRTGRSYHLPTGGALYFDTGVIEVATPMIELAPGCAARAGRSLWESILFLREELDGWQERKGREVKLAGFSTHYNVSFELPEEERGELRSVQRLAVLLTHILPAPIMLLAANRESTGIGVRPRGNRIEITADFTPDAALMIAAATVIVGIVREVMTWPSYDLSVLEGRDIPVVRGFTPEPHSSRKGWVARFSSFPENPFRCDVDEARWITQQGEQLSLREIGGRITRYFSRAIRRYADPLSLRLVGAVMRGRAPSLLELPGRPESYLDVGRLCAWEDLFPERMLPRSRYERVLIHAINRRVLHLPDSAYTPTGVKGWTHIVFRRHQDGSRHVFSLDQLIEHLRGWGVGSDRGRVRPRPGSSSARASARRRRRSDDPPPIAPPMDAPEPPPPVEKEEG